jgi:hypothetical protein
MGQFVIPWNKSGTQKGRKKSWCFTTELNSLRLNPRHGFEATLEHFFLPLFPSLFHDYSIFIPPLFHDFIPWNKGGIKME